MNPPKFKLGDRVREGKYIGVVCERRHRDYWTYVVKRDRYNTLELRRIHETALKKA